MRYTDQTGKQYNWLTVIERAENCPKGNTRWLCKCECGKMKIYRIDMLQQAKTCGRCKPSLMYPTAYKAWCNARSRCKDINHPKYHRYGGRGITFSTDWDDFKVFIKDMGSPPWDDLYKEFYQLDRKDNNEGYSKDNCRWATRLQQANNRENNIFSITL